MIKMTKLGKGFKTFKLLHNYETITSFQAFSPYILRYIIIWQKPLLLKLIINFCGLFLPITSSENAIF